MHWSFILLNLFYLSPAIANLPHRRHYAERDFYALQLESSISPLLVAELFGMEVVGPLGELEGHYVFSSKFESNKYDRVAQKKSLLQRRSDIPILHKQAASGVLWHKKQELRKRTKRVLDVGLESCEQESLLRRRDQPNLEQIRSLFDIQDPIFGEQWHLVNTVQVGHDINVTGVWEAGVTGEGVVVALVDDGLDMSSDDLSDNYFPAGSYDFNDHDSEPKPVLLDDYHGTRCAGEIAAVRNSVCGVGVAYNAKVSGIRILSADISDVDEAVALNYAYQQNHIYSCSWGPPDDGQSMEAPSDLIQRSVVNGINNGRGKRGSIFVFASGNGAFSGDNCNFDGYTNSIFSITVGAIDRQGNHPHYAEKCCAQLAVTYSSGVNDSIHTTDVGKNKCTTRHGGTSAAAPLAAGILALVLSVRPDLTWRDMQYLVLESAVEVDVDDSDWQMTAKGRRYNHKYGYGKFDSWAIVQNARNFTLKKTPSWYHSNVTTVEQDIPQGEEGLKSSISITKEDMANANLENVEHITVTVNIAHGRRGEVSVHLTSPHNVTSRLAEKRSLDGSKDGFENWRFMSVMHWGEEGIGNWTLHVMDTEVNENKGKLQDWKISLWGESIDESKTVPYELPGESRKGGQPTIDFPVTSSPNSTAISSSNGTSTSETASSIPSREPTTPDKVDVVETPKVVSLPSSYDFSKELKDSDQTVFWFFAGIIIILLFIMMVGIFFCMQRKRDIQAKGDRENYEFEVLQASDVDDGSRKSHLTQNETLYDAFGRTSEDGRPFDIGKDDESADEKLLH
ncbi:Protease KEX1 [Neolecta irregularis DAH-3]|uniref:Protease KEX1 n=1 Tax=Neolecta irregularis (strain DAH-3) TaxID=1198029 RepID=A0A1U7LV16_NEOID|nr:Protease KEX1 [Neolecta irregularis DAH-3]|eukprot:OLL26525.1 Protease KEX1 [Neolecta irregularis DAH-3]